MENASRSRYIPILIGIGLLLVGLLSGVLAMLFVVDLRPDPVPVPQVVERVELGRRDQARAVPAPEEEQTNIPPDIATLNRMFKEVAQQVTPAVVYIQVEGAPAGDFSRDWFHNFDSDDLDERFFREMPRQSVGSGVIVSDQGYVVTNHHVVDRAERIRVVLSDKREFGARVVGFDPSTDLAVLKLDVRENESLPVIALGNSDDVEVGEWVLAVGNPFRLTSTVTAGIVSALGRQVNIIEDPLRIEDFIQTDAAINPGNSGGALVNLQGELIGISTAIATESGSYEGYGFAVPVNLMERVVRDLIAYGEVQRGILGVKIQGIDATLAQRLGLKEIGGVYLSEVRRGGAAYQAGLRDGDVVLAINGRGVNAPNELQSTIARHRPGDQVWIEFLRDGQRRQIPVQLSGKDDPAYEGWLSEYEAEEPRPEAEEPRRKPDVSGEVFQLEGWGVGLRELSRRERDAFDTEVGVYLAYVEKGTVADVGGLPRDVVILRIGDEPVHSVEEAVRLLSIAEDEAESVLFQVKRRDGLVAFYDLELPLAP